MTLKIKRLSDKAVFPIRAHQNDAGIDLTCTNITQEINEAGQLVLVYHTDIAIEIPEGYVGLLFQRSSVANKSITMCNAVGVIDSGYRGEVMGKFRSTTDVVPAIYKPGDKFAQLVIVPYITCDLEEVTELSKTDRGEGGFGSTNETAAEVGPGPEANVRAINDAPVDEPGLVAEYDAPTAEAAA